MSKKSSDSKVVSGFIGILIAISALLIIYITYLFASGRVEIVLYCSIIFMAILPPVSMIVFKKIFTRSIPVPSQAEIKASNN